MHVWAAEFFLRKHARNIPDAALRHSAARPAGTGRSNERVERVVNGHAYVQRSPSPKHRLDLHDSISRTNDLVSRFRKPHQLVNATVYLTRENQRSQPRELA